MNPLRPLFTAIAIFLVSLVYAQGENCASALVINGLPYNTPFLQNHNTCNSGNDYSSEDMCGNFYMNGNDFVFEFTPDNDVCVSATVTPNDILGDFDNSIFVTQGCPDENTSRCVAQFTNPDGGALPTTLAGVALKANETYYIIVSSRTEADCFAFSFGLSEDACQPYDDGGTCDNAEVITSLPYTNTMSNCGHNGIIVEGNQCNTTFYNDSPTYIYSFKPNKETCFKVTGQTTDATMRMSVHDTCPTVTDTSCLESQYYYTFREYSDFFTLDSGVTYYFAFSSGSSCTSIDVTFEEVGDVGATCSTAPEIIPVNGSFFYPDATIRCKGDEYAEQTKYNCSSLYEGGNDFVFKYESPGNECIGASFNTSSYGGIYMFKGCPSLSNDSVYAFKERCSFRDPNEVGFTYTINDPGTYYLVVAGRKRFSSFSDRYLYTDFDFDFNFVQNTLDPIGVDCESADILPGTKNIYKPNIDVFCKGNDYGPDDVCGFEHLSGSDYVFEYTPTESFCATVIGRNTFGEGGITVTQGCPSNELASCLGGTTCYGECDSIYVDTYFEAGQTYYILGSSATEAGSFVFDLEIKPNPIGCPVDCENECPNCANATFETSTLANWVGAYGTFDDPNKHNGLRSGAINDDFTRHTIMNAGLEDPVVGNLLMTTGPLGGRYSVRLGNYLAPSEDRDPDSGDRLGGDELTFQFEVTEETQNFFYYYAVVLEDPSNSHTADEQPFFGAAMLDANGDSIQCAKYTVRSANADEGFKTAIPNEDAGISEDEVIYRDWSLVAVPLNDYLGETVTVIFTATDCGLSGHMGYAYIDAFCGDLEITTEKETFTICPGSDITLKAPPGFAEYEWSTGETTQTITNNIAGNYTVELKPFSQSGQNTCTVTLEKEVVDAVDPVADFTFEEGCIDQFIDFENASSGSNDYPISQYQWNFDDGTGTYPDTNRNHAFPGPGNYDVTLTVVNTAGCTDSKTVSIEIPEFPSLDPLNALDTIIICQNFDTSLYADPQDDVDFIWTAPDETTTYSGRTPTINFANTNMSGDYVLLATSKSDTCVTRLDTTYVQVIPTPEFSISENDTLCFNNAVAFLEATGGEQYQWSPAQFLDSASSNMPKATVTETTMFTVEATNTYCPDSTMQVELFVDTYKEMLQVPDQVQICDGDSLMLTPTAGDPIGFLKWTSVDSIIVRDTNFYRQTNEKELHEGYYYIEAFLGEGSYCPYAYDSVLVNIQALPDAQLAPDTAVACEGETVTFTAQNPMPTVKWTNEAGDSLGAGNSFTTPANDAFYYALFKDDLGCTNTDSVFADEFQMIAPDLGNNRTACLGQTVAITPFNLQDLPEEYSFSWSNGESTDTVYLSETQTITLTVSQNGCSKSDAIRVTFQDPADFSMGNDTLLCESDSLFLDYRGFGEEITWNDGYRDFTRWITNPGGNYSVTITSGACVLEDDMTISFEALDPVTLPEDTEICLGETYTVNASPAGQDYTWFDNGSTVATGISSVDVSTIGNHTIVLQGETSVCTTRDTMEVAVIAPLNPNMPDERICETDSVEVNASISDPTANYTWNDGTIGAVRTIKEAGTYEVTIVHGPCTVVDALDLNHDPVPTVELGADATICEIDNHTFAADNTNWESYTWNTGANTTAITVSDSGWYWLETEQGLCTFRDSVYLFNDTVPNFSLGPDQAICETGMATFDPQVPNNPDFVFDWNTGATTPSISTNTAGNYSLEITNGLCAFSDAAELTVQALPGVDLGPDQVSCLGDVVRVGFTAENATYSWNTGETTDSIDIRQSGTYTLTVNQELCTETDQVNVLFDQLQKPNLGEDYTVCDDLDTVLDARTVAQSYLWIRNGDTLPDASRSIVAQVEGRYIVNAVQGTCFDADTIDIAIQPQHSVTVSKDSILCQGETYTLEAQTSASNPIYSWSTGATSDQITVSETDQYTIAVTQGVCKNSATANIIFVPHPYVDLENGVICEDDVIGIGEYFEVDGRIDSAEYQWSTGEQTGVIYVSSAGRYVETISIEHCFDTDYYDLTVVPKPVPRMSAPVETCENNLVSINTGLPGLETRWSLVGTRDYEITPAVTGTYIATITFGPCEVQDSVDVTIHKVPREEFEDLYICPNDSVPLSSTLPDTRSIWNGIEKPVYYATNNEEIDLVLINEYGCTSQQTIATFEDKDCTDDVYIPTSFSPDNDGINENFRIFLSEHVTFKSLTVYDRWGKIIYQSVDSYEPWDGTHEGKLVKTGTYAYQVKYIDQYQDHITKVGSITVLK